MFATVISGTYVSIDGLTKTFYNSYFRYLVLYKYGGAYQDFDVTWASRVPDSLLAYPAVIGMEWTTGRPPNGFPETFNLGVFMARRHSPWLRHHIMTNRDYRDHDWGYNVQEMSYKTYELHPDLIYLDRHLQVKGFIEVLGLTDIFFFYNCYRTYMYLYKYGGAYQDFFTIAMLGTCTSLWRGQQTSNNCYLRYMYKYGGAYQDFLQLLSSVPVQVYGGANRLPTIVISGICTSMEGLTQTFYDCYFRYLFMSR